jgi:ketosteroid isomerase-like protein
MKKTDELLKIDQEFSSYSKANGVVKAFEKYLSEDATLLPNNSNAIIGKQNILEFLSAGGNYEMTWTPEFAAISESNDFGYTWGNWTMTVQNEKGEATSTEKGKYSDCWIKEDIEWKVLVDMSNMNPSVS